MAGNLSSNYGDEWASPSSPSPLDPRDDPNNPSAYWGQGGAGSSQAYLQATGPFANARETSQYASDLMSMEMAGRHDAGTIDANVGPSEFYNILSASEDFASQAGYRYFPTKDQINQMVSAGIDFSDNTQVRKFLAGVNGISGKMPWLSSGLNPTQYQNTIGEMQAAIADYTGNLNSFPGLAAEAVNHGGAAWLKAQLQYGKASNTASMPWLKFGMTYNDWKNYKRQSQQIVQQRFGPKATDAQYAQTFKENAPNNPDMGGAIRPATGSAVNTGETTVKPTGQSSVR